MSDPFERLRDSADFGASADVAAIKSRARGIERRRRMILSGSAVAVAVIAVAGILIGTNPKDSTTADLAQEYATTPTPTTQAQRSGPLAAVTLEDSNESAGAIAPGASTAGSGAAAKAPAAEGQTSADTTSAAAPARGGDQVPELKATLEVEDQMIGRGKTFTLKVCNQTSGTVTREFGTGQRYDFEVSRDGELVWRWSDGMAFTQVIGEESWKAKECKTWTEEWDATNSEGAPVPTGDYSAVGILKSSPELRTGAEKFSVAAL